MKTSHSMTVRSVFVLAAKLFESETACLQLEHGTIRKISYGEFYQDVRALGTYLLHANLKGKRVALIGKNSYEWVLVHMAAITSGVVIVPLDKELSPEELLGSLARVQPKLVFYSEELQSKITGCKIKDTSLAFIRFQGIATNSLGRMMLSGSVLLGKGSVRYDTLTIDPDAVAALLFTSGTTSQSKIVKLSNRNIVFDMKNGSEPFNITLNDRFLSILPLHHMFEYSAGFLTAIDQGASIYFSDGIRHITHELQSFKPTVLVVVPRIVDALHANIRKGIKAEGKTNLVAAVTAASKLTRYLGIDPRPKLFHKVYSGLGGALRFMLSGAAPLRGDILKGMQDLGFTVYQGYGLTECSPAVALTTSKCNDSDSVGLPVKGTKISIHKPDVNGVGEVVVSGPHIMLGYYKDTAATKSVLRDGYFYTGDLGVVKPNGCLKIVGRQKNIIVTSGGKKIYPEQIEYLLSRSSAIKDVVVQGGSSRHSVRITATIVLQDSASSDERARLEAQALSQIDQVNQTLAAYEQIQGVHIRNTDFTRTSTLKIKRHLIDHND